ncbi:hypothetical protein [Dehalococcoides mccartyi]|uniref:hypothetical protein n=1 Tax=Dehalococcoides mccartyi TaxID=61435 RepID=UPI002FC9B15F
MENQFSPAEIDQIVCVARITAPGFTRDQYEALVTSQSQLANTGFYEAAWAVADIIREKGIDYSDAVDAIEKLLNQKTQLEGTISKLVKTISELKTEFHAASQSVQKIHKELRQTEESLKNVQTQRQQEEQALCAFRDNAVKEKECLTKNIEEYQKAADLTAVEIEEAGELKKEFNNGGYNLDLALNLCQEFGKSLEPRKQLAEELHRYGSLKNSLEIFIQESEASKNKLQTEINDLKVKGEQLTVSVSNLQAEYARQEVRLSQLNSEIMGKNGVISFYQRYRNLRELIDYLGGFNEVTFHHCTWCGSLFWILKRGNTPFSSYRCPWCSFLMVEPDETAYKAIQQPVGALRLLP